MNHTCCNHSFADTAPLDAPFNIQTSLFLPHPVLMDPLVLFAGDGVIQGVSEAQEWPVARRKRGFRPTAGGEGMACGD